MRVARLLDAGRYFCCPGCQRLTAHPPLNLDCYTVGYGYCSLCGFCVLEDGDKLGVVEQDREGKRRTRLFTQKEREEREATRWKKLRRGAL